MNKKKKVRLIIILVIFILFILLLINIFSNNIKTQKETKNKLKVVYTISYNGNKLKGHKFSPDLFMFYYINLYKKDNYYVGNINIGNKKLLKEIVDYDFALNDIYGNSLKDCYLNKNSYEVRIPSSYYKKNNNIPVKLQVVSKLSEKEARDVKVNLSIKRIFKSNKVISLDSRSDETKFSINKKIKKSDIKLYINKNQLIPEDYYTYSSRDHILTLNMSPLLISDIDVVISPSSVFNILTTINAASTTPPKAQDKLASDNLPNDIDDVKSITFSLTGSGTAHADYVGSGKTSYNTWVAKCNEDSDTNKSDCEKAEAYEAHSSSKYVGGNYSVYDFLLNLSGRTIQGKKGDKTYSIEFSSYTYAVLGCTESNLPSAPDGIVTPSFKIVALTNKYVILSITMDKKITSQTGSGLVKFVRDNDFGEVAAVKKHKTNNVKMIKFTLYDDKSCTGDNEGTKTTDDKGEVKWIDLDLGTTYYLKEIENELYTPTENNCQPLVAESSATAKKHNIDNTPYLYSFSFYKKSKLDNAVVPNASFNIYFGKGKSASSLYAKRTGTSGYKADDFVKTATSDANGKVSVCGLPDKQDYYAKETTVSGTITNANGHLMYNDDSTSKVATISASDVTKYKETDPCPATANAGTVTNREYIYCARVKKTDKATGEPLAGAVFTDNNALNPSVTTGSDGIATFYYGDNSNASTITETTAPDGYALSNPSAKVVNHTQMTYYAYEANNLQDASHCVANADSYIYSNPTYVLNWYKSSSYNNHNTDINGARFKIKDSSGTYLKFDATKKNVTDDNGVTKNCYIYNKNGAIDELESSNTGSNDGEVCVAKIPGSKNGGTNPTYTVVETRPGQFHAFGDTKELNLVVDTVFKSKDASDVSTTRNTFYNCPTEYQLTKLVLNDVSNDSDQIKETTEELKLLDFGFIGKSDKYTDKTIYFYDMGNSLYEYAGYGSSTSIEVIERNPSDNTTRNIVSRMHVNDNRVLNVNFLPWELKYQAQELPNDCKDNYNNKCDTQGFYLSEDKPEFTIKTDSSSCKASTGVIKSTMNNPVTQINFKKEDFYKYYTNEAISEIEDKKLFDTIDFNLKDEYNNILCLEKVDNGVYRYRKNEKGSNCTKVLNTYNGSMSIWHLCRDRKYIIEEISQTNSGSLILPVNHPSITYSISSTKTDADKNKDSVTKIIRNKPTEVRFQKRDLKYGNIISDETTTFNIRRCDKNVKLEDCTVNNSELIKFNNRSVITTSEVSDEEDYGKEVYRYPYKTFNSKNNSLVEDLHPYKGDLIIRYLPSGYYVKNSDGSNGDYHIYNYILVETKAPIGYDLPTNGNEITRFNVSGNTTNVDVIEVPNKPTKILVEKYDMATGERLNGARFKLYKVPNDKNGNSLYDSNKSLLNQTMEEIKLHTVRDGEYERNVDNDVLDTYEFTTCTNNCNLITDDLYKTFSNGRYENTPLANEEKKVEIKQGQAIIQYLEVNTYYIIEEVKAPDGYELPKKKEDRFRLVYLPESDNNVYTKFSMSNEENYFQFYKFDEYNNLLDGAKFKLQKLDDNKKYHDVNIVYDKEKSKSMNMQVYRMKDITSNSEVSDSTNNKDEEDTNNLITTKDGTAIIYRLAEGQYRILEVEAAPGYELPKKTINVATFFVDSDGKVYGSAIITNKKPTIPNKIKPSASAELQVDVQTGKQRVRYFLIIISIIFIIYFLIKYITTKKTKK